METFVGMGDLTRSVHLIAGRHYGEEATCKGKARYISEVNATEQAAHETSRKMPMEAYPCAFCDSWHVGRALTPQEGARFLVEALGIQTWA